MNLARYESVYAITFDAASDIEAKETAVHYHEIFRETLQVEGAGYPHDIRLGRLRSNGRDLLAEPNERTS